ncbi:hypothetical protein ABK040_012629 [Willaertia magna]
MGNFCSNHNHHHNNNNQQQFDIPPLPVKTTTTITTNNASTSTTTLNKPERTKKYDATIKALLIGESGVGKTALLLKYVEDKFEESLLSTIGVDFKEKVLVINDKLIKLQIFDTAGQERYRTITNSYYRGVSLIIVVFDLTDEKGLEKVQKWINEVKKFSTSNVVGALVGNKTDLESERQITELQAREFAQNFDLLYFEVSAKYGTNISLIFEQLVERVI